MGLRHGDNNRKIAVLGEVGGRGRLLCPAHPTRPKTKSKPNQSARALQPYQRRQSIIFTKQQERFVNTVKQVLAQKTGPLIYVCSDDMVVDALCHMRDNRVRSVLVIDEGVLVGIVTQGDCAIKVLLPGLDAKLTPVSQVMTGNPVTVDPKDKLEICMSMMATRRFRHLPVLEEGKVVGVISIGDIVKEVITDFERNVGDLMGYITRGGVGG
jgi:hypothetical protein